MAYWLFKEEPTHYSLDQLKEDGTTVWDGVSNNLALRNLRQVKPGDRVLFYHTGSEKAVVGEMRVSSIPEPTPEERTARLVKVEVTYVRHLPQPVTLEAIKHDAALRDWDLVRLPRLSVVPMTSAQWRRIDQMSRSKATKRKPF
jgi:predicted RNA-binding protein with PUA-like domain